MEESVERNDSEHMIISSPYSAYGAFLNYPLSFTNWNRDRHFDSVQLKQRKVVVGM